jgi:hypothetical protein
MPLTSSLWPWWSLLKIEKTIMKASIPTIAPVTPAGINGWALVLFGEVFGGGGDTAEFVVDVVGAVVEEALNNISTDLNIYHLLKEGQAQYTRDELVVAEACVATVVVVVTALLLMINAPLLKPPFSSVTTLVFPIPKWKPLPCGSPSRGPTDHT